MERISTLLKGNILRPLILIKAYYQLSLITIGVFHGFQNVLTVVLVVLIVVAGVVGYFAGSSAAVPRSVTVTSTVAPSVITTTVTKTEKVTITETVTPKPTPTVTPPPTPPPYWPKILTIYSAAPGGTFYVLASAVASLIKENLKVDVKNVPGASAANVLAISKGDANLGIAYVYLGAALQNPELARLIWKEEIPEYDKVRLVVGSLYPAYDYIFKRRDFPASTTEELFRIAKERPVSIGVDASIIAFEGVTLMVLAQKYGISLKDLRISVGPATDLYQYLLEGRIDVVFDASGLKFAAAELLETKSELVGIIEYTKEDLEYLKKTLGVGSAIVPAGNFKFQDRDWEVPNRLCSHTCSKRSSRGSHIYDNKAYL